MILLIRLFLYLGIILVFMVLPPLLLGFTLARALSWWTKQDKVHRYVTVNNPKLSRLLVKRCRGQFTNIPKWSWRYYVNEQPRRLSCLGAIDYVVVAVLSVVWVYHMGGYFFFPTQFNPNVPLAIILLMGHAVVAVCLLAWNGARRNVPEGMTRAEWACYKKRL